VRGVPRSPMGRPLTGRRKSGVTMALGKTDSPPPIRFLFVFE
jgi:hypothetical protein